MDNESKGLLLPEGVQPGSSSVSRAKTFTEVMVEFKIKYPVEPEARVQKECSIRSKTSWEEVLEVLEASAAAYTRNTGLKGAFKKTKEFIESKADTVERVTKVIPDVDYAKPILGTLTFLLQVFDPRWQQAFQQTSKVREEVKAGIEKLKRKFGLVEDYIAMYSTKEKVVDAVTTLHVTILKAIEDVIGYYTRHIIIKGLSALWDGKNYEKSLLQCLENISKDGNELIHEANTAHKQETHEIAGNVNKPENKELKQLFYRATTPEPAALPAPTVVTQHDMLDFLISTDIETADIDYILSQRELIIPGGHDRTEQIMKSTQLREWLVQDDSKELLIHGNSEPEPISPVSFFCALLMRNLRGVEQFRSIAFFCGCHPYEDFGGARPMIMSLLAQLLQQQSFDLGFIDHELAYRMDDGDIGAFCFVFRQLVHQVKNTESVFCVIDGINFYEGFDEESLQETAYVLCSLLDLTRERGVIFKILVTSPSITVDTRLAIEDEDYLALPQRDANALGYSDLRFERQWREGFGAESEG
ncbi:uncharacterized protein PG998_002620 [Apiospora kogelbergensis]|uniref:uncharacterized protein n=1 Tax=Apiospora kogelbergensis TaxID=1337665 RepID=UPI00312F7B71